MPNPSQPTIPHGALRLPRNKITSAWPHTYAEAKSDSSKGKGDGSPKYILNQWAMGWGEHIGTERKKRFGEARSTRLTRSCTRLIIWLSFVWSRRVLLSTGILNFNFNVQYTCQSHTRIISTNVHCNKTSAGPQTKTWGFPSFFQTFIFKKYRGCQSKWNRSYVYNVLDVKVYWCCICQVVSGLDRIFNSMQVIIQRMIHSQRKMICSKCDCAPF